MKNSPPTVKGARDFYPEQMALRSWLYDQARKVSELYGYQEYDGPFLETVELYAAKSGDELVREQSFAFQDRGGEWITLRPELTPSLARMVASRQTLLNFPLRWWSFGPMWRYERPQKGRSREFFQWNIDLIGSTSAIADAEMIAIGAGFLKATGLSPSQVKIKTNNRRLMDSQLGNLAIPVDQRPGVLKLIDRQDKLSSQQWESQAVEHYQLNRQQVDGLYAMLADSSAWQLSAEMVELFAGLEAFGAAEYVEYAPNIVRGLDYYTGTVFECRDVDGEYRAIFGGGRYDNLVGDVGGDALPGVGFAMGDMVISLVLEKFDCLPKPEQTSKAFVFIPIFDASLTQATLQLSAQVRQAGIHTVVYPEAIKLPKQMKYADRIGASAALLLGSDELANSSVTLKDLRGRTQSTLPIVEAIDALKKLLNS